jgi:hypothetical protein
MQMRWVCTEVTLGLKETSRSGEKDLWHDQSAIKTLYCTVSYKCANVA